MKKGDIVKTIEEVNTQYYDPIPKDSILRIEVCSSKYIEITKLNSPTGTISFSRIREDDTPYYNDFVNNIKVI